ncbi:MAG: YeeE/YedE family protein [Burkholderiales bacterium]|nr:YeeE/YedE family protein [Burkholderiales bacterium]
MNIVNFTPISALTGGALIGLAAAIMWWLLGKMTGISSILGNALSARGLDLEWRVAFIGGLLAAGIIAVFAFSDAVEFEMEADYVRAVAAGLLVGFGTQLGSGCTSGHGVCGVSRVSPRSLIATGVFMLSGFVIVFVVRNWL